MINLMTMKNLIVKIVVMIFVCSATAQTKVGDAMLPNKLNFSGKEITLNGAGMREKLWIDLYAGGLYLKTKSSNASQIINSNELMAIRLHIVSGLVTQEKMVNAVNEGFENTTTGLATPAEIAKFTGFFNEEIVRDNIFDIVAENNRVTVYKNSREIGSMEGEEFKKALFGIWLSEKPADKKLKKGMLGL